MHGVVEMAGVPGSKILHLKALWYVIIVTLIPWWILKGVNYFCDSLCLCLVVTVH